MDLPKIMTFHPTMEEFKDFSGFIQKMENTGAHLAGLAKVIPPKGWVARKEGYKNVGDIVIPCPITQEIQGRGGVYEVFNMEPRNIKSGGMSVSEFQKKATSKGYETPLHSGADDLERRYWTNVAYNPPLYGADVSGSLYDRDQDVWNIGHLRTVLDSVFSTLGDEGGLKIEGVNTAYLYFGMWKSTFAWHTEDMDLYSINYLHFGAPKFWYVVPPKYGRRLERVAQMFFKSKADECPGFLRHKCYLLSPTILKKFNVPFYKIMQEEGQFMITFPYAYHAGFNHGYNCAESTNFATERWIEYGKRCRRCYCIKEMVQIDMDCFVKKYQPGKYKAWINDEDVAPHPEDDEKRKVSRSQSLAGCHKKSGEQPSKRHPLSIDFGSTPRKETKRTFEDTTETGRKKFEHLPSKTLKTSLRSKLKKRSILVSCRKSMETRAERLKLSSSASEVSKETTKMRRFAARESCHERQDADVEPANKMCTRSSSVAEDAVHSGQTRAVSVADFTRSVDVPPPLLTSTASRPTRRRRSFLRTNQKRRQCKNDFYTPLAERVKLRRASDLEKGSKSSSDNDSDAPELEKVDASRPTEHRPSDERSSSASETASQTIGEAQDVHTKCQMSGSRRTPRRPIASVSVRRQPIRRHTRSSEDPEKRAEGSSSSSDPEELQMPRLVPVSTDADPRILRSHRREDLRCSGEDAPTLDLFK